MNLDQTEYVIIKRFFWSIMKRLIVIFFSVILCCTMIGCKKQDPVDENGEITSEPSKEPKCAKSMIHTEKLTEVLSSEDGNQKIMLGDFSYPQIENKDHFESVDKINADIKQRVEAEFKDSYNEGSMYAKEVYAQNSDTGMQTRLFPFVTEQRFEITYNDYFLVSYKVIGYTDFGGAHPNTYQKSYTYDILTGELLPITYFYTDSEEEAKQLIAQTFYTLFTEEPELFYPNAGDILTQGNFTYGFYITKDGLSFYINEYDIAPHAAGIQEVSILFDPKVEDFRNLDRLGIEIK